MDLAADARLFPSEPGPLVRSLTGRELAVDKVLAVFGRAEARDFVDLMAVEQEYGLDVLFELAREKDGGFPPSVFAEMVSRFERLRREEFDIDTPGYERLRQTVALWREKAINLSPGRRRAVNRGLDDDLGMGL